MHSFVRKKTKGILGIEFPLDKVVIPFTILQHETTPYLCLAYIEYIWVYVIDNHLKSMSYRSDMVGTIAINKLSHIFIFSITYKN
jgi:hypothetical protein